MTQLTDLDHEFASGNERMKATRGRAGRRSVSKYVPSAAASAEEVRAFIEAARVLGRDDLADLLVATVDLRHQMPKA